MIGFVSTLKKWFGHGPEPSPSPSPALPVPFGMKDVINIQQALNRIGFHLTEDGVAGDRTTAALQQYQKQMGIRPSYGQIDDQTWSSLGLSAEGN
jgi:peptidoglycan hydrolase-like protein with peptidoglycan-binding domain